MYYQELIDDHDKIDALTQQLESIVRCQSAPSENINCLIRDLEYVVIDHLQKEDSFIYPQLASSSDPANAVSLISEFDEIKRDWESYLMAWKGGAADKD